MPHSSVTQALSCRFSVQCSGCEWISKENHEQRLLKLDHLHSLWGAAISLRLPEVEWVEINLGALRDRADLMIDSRTGDYRIGLFDRGRTGIVDLSSCLQMSPALEEWLVRFRALPRIQVARGSVRLRVSPSGVRGVWLDLANVDVKNLLDERESLDALRAEAIVEIGQRRKRLIEREGRLKLSDPVLEPWFETYVGTGPAGEHAVSTSSRAVPLYSRAVPLYCTIGSFTQPGFRANRSLVEVIRGAIAATHAKVAAEFGSGIGNFTLPLASLCEMTHAYEVDRLALEGLCRTLAEQSLETRVQIHEGNFQTQRKIPPDFSGVELMLVDPPRSGLMSFLDPLEAMPQAKRPPLFVYVSCFAESFVADSARLLAMGYRATHVAVVDQFPQSRHYEIVATFTR